MWGTFALILVICFVVIAGIFVSAIQNEKKGEFDGCTLMKKEIVGDKTEMVGKVNHLYHYYHVTYNCDGKLKDKVIKE